jgi:uncharacterized protein (TIGR03437 family)
MSAQPGETIILWGTGFGSTTPPFPNGQLPNQLYSVANPVTIQIGTDTKVAASAVALAISIPALYQVVVTIPASLPQQQYPVRIFEQGTSQRYEGGQLVIGTPPPTKR